MRFEASSFFDILLSRKDSVGWVHVLVCAELHGEDKLSLKTSELSSLNSTWLTNLLTIIDPSIAYTVFNPGNVCFTISEEKYIDFFIKVKKLAVHSDNDLEALVKSNIHRLEINEALALTHLVIE